MPSNRDSPSRSASQQRPAGQRPTSQPPQTSWHCKPCNLLFSTWEGLLKHKGSMRNSGKLQHFHCHICGESFKTEIAEIKHIQQNHAKEQDLECPGCGKGPFTRLAGLMAHIEKDCIRIDIYQLQEMREKKSEFTRKLEALTKEPVKSNYTSYMPSTIDGSEGGVRLGPQTSADAFELRRMEFPGLPNQPSMTSGASTQNRITDSGENKRPGAWNEEKQLFENAPAARRPTQEQLQAATAPSARRMHDSMDPADPDHPGFSAAQCYNKFSEKFVCPKPGCIKTFKSAGGLMGHLRSVHSGTKYCCPYCLKKFNSLAAITAHAESQGVRCRIRDTETYDAYLDQLTAGMVDVSIGKNEDGTLKYKTTEAAREMFGRKQIKAKEEEPAHGSNWW